MLKYAIILLDKTSTPFCYADNPNKDNHLMPIETLKKAIVWCMKENLRIQFVYPDYELPQEYLALINSIDHADIKHLDNADVTVLNGWNEFQSRRIESTSIVIRLTKDELFNQKELRKIIDYSGHVSIVITDAENFSSKDFQTYQQTLSEISKSAVITILNGKLPQISILTDRLLLSSMNNCNAGEESITIAYNGNFYICPSFFYQNENDYVGNLNIGLDIKNPNLYSLKNAPICRICDSFHCRRCVWLNRKNTLEVNTPTREQCIVSHIERNASLNLLNNVREHGQFLPETEIKEIDYLDPFEKLIRR